MWSQRICGSGNGPTVSLVVVWRCLQPVWRIIICPNDPVRPGKEEQSEMGGVQVV
jgi:hypothetical protein